MCPKSSLLLLLVLVFCRKWGSYFILQVKAPSLIPLLPKVTSIRLTAATCCEPEGWQCIWYWLSPSSFADSISSMKSQLGALIGKQGMWCMVSVGGVCFWHEQLLFLGSSWLLTAGWGTVPGERALCPPRNLSLSCTEHVTTCRPRRPPGLTWLGAGRPLGHWCGPACH